MNRKTILICLFYIISLQTRAQENNPLINSAEAIQAGVKMHDAGKYKEALKEYQQIKQGDTNYVLALYEMVLTCVADSQYNLGIHYCEEALSLKANRERCPDFLDQYGSLLDYSNQQERSLRVFDSAIALYPAQASLYVNKGTTLIRMQKYKEAEKVLQQALMVNPYSSSAHFKLGVCVLNEGKIIPAFLCFVANLIMEPDGKFSKSSISLMDKMAKSKDDVVELVNNRKEEPSDNFREVEQIVLSKIALDKQYKSLIALDDPISRQMQVIFEKLSYDQNDPDFYMQYYIPFYRNMFDGKKFEYLVNYAFSDVNIQLIKDFNKNKKKEVDAFVSDVVEYFNQVRTTRELQLSKRNTGGSRFYFEQGKLIGKGISGKALSGPWEFYYPAGNIKATGLYNEKGGKDGPWIYYYFNGKKKGEELYRNDKQEGPEIYYYDQGVVSSRASYKNGKADGEHITYYREGATKMIEYFKEGVVNGVRNKFYESGLHKSFETIVNDKLNGPFKTYYANGQVELEGTYVDDLLNGPYKAWYSDGTLSMEGQYDKDKLTGVLKRYHENGKLKTLETYDNGILEGEYSAYYDNGQLHFKYFNKKGKLNGDVNYYDKDGKLYSTLTFNADFVKSGRYFDKTGKQISLSETKDGKLELLTYTPDGTKKSQMSYNEKGETIGTGTFYYGSGKIKETDAYTNGNLNGDVVAYFPNGQKSSFSKYVDNKKDGYYISWLTHGGRQEEGWYKDDNPEGEWLRYNEQGSLLSRTGFLNGELNGMKTNYWPNGKKESEYIYDAGSLKEVTEYDTTGQVLNHAKLDNGNGKLVLLHLNGKPYSEGYYTKGYINGPYTYYYFDGSVQAVQYFKNGLLDSVYKLYDFGGKISTEGAYKMNEKTGTWKYYRSNGSLWYTEEYKMDKLQGKRIFYFRNGKIDTEIPFDNGERNGLYKRFNEEGIPMVQVRYENGLPTGYSYLGSNSEPVPEIPLVQGNGTIKALYPNGSVSLSVVYIDGLQHGPHKLYFPNGKTYAEDSQIYGILEGPAKEYYPDGTLRSVYNYLHDNANGPYKEYNAKGVLVEEGNWYNGVSHGEQRFYDDNGKLKQVRIYYYGQLQRVK